MVGAVEHPGKPDDAARELARPIANVLERPAVAQFNFDVPREGFPFVMGLVGEAEPVWLPISLRGQVQQRMNLLVI